MNHDMLRALSESPWAVLPSTLQVLTSIATSPVAKDVAALALPGRSTQPSARNAGSVAVLPLYGILTHRSWMFGGQSTSYQSFAGLFRQVMADESVKAIVIDCASPGGEVAGCPELAALIYAARGQKRIVASVNAQMASAALWICSAADEVTITPSGDAGSVGCVAIHEDISKAMDMQGRKVTLIASSRYKTETSPYEPLNPDARAYIQSRVDEIGSTFLRDIAKHRGVSVSEAHSNFGQGRMLSASNAVAAKLCDRIESLDQTITRVARGGSGSQGQRLGSLGHAQASMRARLAAVSGPSVAAAPTVASVPVRVPGTLPDSMRFMGPMVLGDHLGRAFHGDPYMVAAGYDITVRRGTEAQMAADTGRPLSPPHRILLGCAVPERRTVYINSAQSRWSQRTTTAHECGHVLQPDWTEAQVVTFAEAFMVHSPTTDMSDQERTDRHRQLTAAR